MSTVNSVKYRRNVSIVLSNCYKTGSLGNKKKSVNFVKFSRKLKILALKKLIWIHFCSFGILST